MANETLLVYNFASGDNTYPHSGNFTIGIAGSISVDDSDGSDDAIFGDFTHTGGADTADQNVSASSVAGINVSDTVDLRYKYTFTGSDGSSGTIYFVATNSTANYGPLFMSDTPLTSGVTYTFGTFNTDGAVPYSSLVPCFTSGTSIATSKGPRFVESLKEGDQILTRDNGFQPVRWVGRCTTPALGKTAPICIGKDVLGNTSELLVSPNHRMLVVKAVADLYFGERELLVCAKHLLGTAGICRRIGGVVTYVHILFDEHQIVVANSSFSESFFPGPIALSTLEDATRQEVLDLFPELSLNIDRNTHQTARMCLNKREAGFLQRLAA
jgi:hypothetical protein